ncbi:MAG: protein phosphatase 2C domain-containing protein [Fermentimonas sp.]|nr:protein phosphatase 2C domain-containing protein [Fermentimonas sp.]
MISNLLIKSISPKLKNEDFIETVINVELNFKAIVLGDGIGSHYKPDEGSEFCVKSLKKHLENCKSLNGIDFKELFKKVHSELKENFSNIEDDTIDKTQAYGTTLICAIELEDKYIVAYLGNGSAWHIRGNFHTFSPQRYLPWNAINVLNPHTVEENGKEALYKFIALESTENQILPSVIEINKDNELFGDIIIISTDGLYSNDHNPIAKDREGNIWIAGERKMELLFNRLKNLINENKFEEQTINDSIDEYLKEINESKLVDDDTTFGIIFNNIYQQKT